MAGHIADSASIDWCSPLWITDGAKEVLGEIDVDPCGNKASEKRVKANLTLMLPEHDGLKTNWRDFRISMPDNDDSRQFRTFYCNSPFGTYYIHKETKQILLPKQLKNVLEAMCVDADTPTAEEKRRMKELKAKYETQTIADWVEKCATEAQAGMEGIQLGPLNADTTAWQDFIEETAAAILYIRGRVYFEQIDLETLQLLKTGPAPMACALTYWGSTPDLFAKVFAEHGHTHILR